MHTQGYMVDAKFTQRQTVLLKKLWVGVYEEGGEGCCYPVLLCHNMDCCF